MIGIDTEVMGKNVLEKVLRNRWLGGKGRRLSCILTIGRSEPGETWEFIKMGYQVGGER